MRILYIDDNDDLVMRAEEKLRALGHEVFTAQDYARAHELLTDESNRIQVVIADHALNGMDGFNFVLGIPAAYPTVAGVCVLAQELTRSEANQLEMSGIRIFYKPVLIEKVAREMRVAPPVAAKKPEIPAHNRSDGLLGDNTDKPPRRRGLTRMLFGS